MNKTYIKVSITVIMLLILVLIVYKFMNFYEHYSNSLKWSSLNFCILSATLSDVLKENQIYFSNIKNDWTLYIPCNYESVNSEYNNVPVKSNAMYFFIDDSDYMIAKEELWKNLVNIYGEDEAVTMTPKTYLLDNEENVTKFKNEFNSDKIYIMKKNIQRQEGLKIINSLDKVLDIVKKEKGEYKYTLIQELLQNPYLISGRKINLRVYVLVICTENKFDVYMYNDGFMYYTAELFKKNSLDSGPNITTGYIDRKVYQENPLTHLDFKVYLDSTSRQLTRFEKETLYHHGSLSKHVFNNIENLISKVFKSYHNKIGKNKKLFNNVKFQLFGTDVAISDDLSAQIMEINKGPDLGAKDKRDSELKHNLVRDIFNIININKDKHNEYKTNFIKL